MLSNNVRAKLSKAFDLAISITAVAVLALSVIALTSDGKGVRAALRERKRAAEEKKLIQQEWTRLAERPQIGARNGEVAIVEIGDYECPYCRDMHPVIKRLHADTDIRIAYLQLPLPSHPVARPAALAALCAQEAGRFAEMHDLLMTTDAWVEAQDWGQLAARAGVPDTTALLSCMNTERMSRKLAADEALAGTLGVASTPVFLAPKGVLRGATTYEELERLARK